MVSKIIVLLMAAVCGTYAGLPEESMPVPDLIRYWGYPVESHEAKTVDGYYLTLHRIPHGKRHRGGANVGPKPVVFLQHGLLASSSNWVVNKPEQSLGFMLADAGYDVWMGNVRGNTYSKKHDTYDIDSKEFWDFSFDEISKFDLPAMVELALAKSNQSSLYYVGHSQGTMMIWAGVSENQFLKDKIKLVFALAPVARLKNIYSPIKYLSYFDSAIKMASEVLGIREFMPSGDAVREIAEKGCPLYEKLCDGVLELISGYNKADLNQTRTPVYLTHTPAGTSMKNMMHFSQLVMDGHFQKYNYGLFGNMYVYKTWSPPKYEINKVNVPVVLISGNNDWLADPKDVAWLRTQLPQVVKHQKVIKYNHLDFIWGMSARNKVYKPIIKTIRRYERLTADD